VVGLQVGSRGNIRFSLAKLNPANMGDPSNWQSMFNSDRGGVTMGTYDRTGDLVDNLDGTYSYTFDADVTAQTDPITGDPITFEPTLTHRLVVQLSGRVNGISVPPVNAVVDFVPNGDPVTDRRDVISTDNCNDCHGAITFHGSRYEAGYCVVCHNPNMGNAESDLALGDMSFMTHAIHAPGFRADGSAPEYELGGENYAEVGYPQDLRHCSKCHSLSDETPQGDNWKMMPNDLSCGGCHEGTAARPGGTFAYDTHVAGFDNSQCAGCHGVDNIEDAHLTVNPTTNNPSIPAGFSEIEYEIDSFTINGSNQAVIRFRILDDGASLDLNNLPPEFAGSSRAPSFLLAYALPQDGFDAPLDYNNIGENAAQPVGVGIPDLVDGSDGSLTGPDVDGFYEATTTYAFPAGSTLRAVSLQGYYTETVGGEEIARHAISVVEPADGDDARREIVDSNKCASCHEWFEAHGGNRVFEVQNCAMCHNPNLTSSGRTADPTGLTADQIARVESTLAGNGKLPTDPLAPGPLDGADPLTWPEESQNIRELIHGIHAAAMRSGDYAFVRLFRGSPSPYNFAHVTYPNELANCEACHMEGTYDTNLPMGELAGTRIVPSATPDDRTAVAAARGTVPNDEDIVWSPAAAACGSCHNGVQSVNHMIQNGSYIDGPRSGYLDGNVETCNVCHGTGRSVDAAVAHDW
jgi:OmcA/MtrC family decaheme c-type cytochrome